jgi:hypothetical protein
VESLEIKSDTYGRSLRKGYKRTRHPKSTFKIRVIDEGMKIGDVAELASKLIHEPSVDSLDENALVLTLERPDQDDFGGEIWVMNDPNIGFKKVQDRIYSPYTSRVVGSNSLAFAQVYHEMDKSTNGTTFRMLRIHLDAPSAEVLPMPSDIGSATPLAVSEDLIFGTCRPPKGGVAHLCTLSTKSLFHEVLKDALEGTHPAKYFASVGFAFVNTPLGVHSSNGSKQYTTSVTPKQGQFVSQGDHRYFSVNNLNESSLYLLGATPETLAPLVTFPSTGRVGSPMTTLEDGRALFVAAPATDSFPHNALWVTDGTKNGTKVFFEKEKFEIAHSRTMVRRVGKWVYMAAVDQTEGKAKAGLYRVSMDGKILERVNIGPSLLEMPHHLIEIGKHLMFIAAPTGSSNRQVWVVENAGD